MRRYQQPQFKAELIEALNMSENTFYARMNGTTEPKISEALVIQKLFEKYGVDDFWGYERIKPYRKSRRLRKKSEDAGNGESNNKE